MASYRKCGEKWSVTVQVAGVRRSKSFFTKAQARNWALEMERQMTSADGVDSGGRVVALVEGSTFRGLQRLFDGKFSALPFGLNIQFSLC